MTKKTKEAIKATMAIVIAVVAVIVLWIYPLNQAGKIIGRPDQELAGPEPAEFGLTFDTLSFVTEDNIPLAGRLFPASPEADSARGTVILVHGLFGTSLSQSAKAAALHDAGFVVITYDQRAYGLSEGNYRSGGFFEGIDLQEVVYRLDLEDRLIHPVILWGEGHGATAALRAWVKETPIDYVVAENPVVTGRDWQKRVVAHDERTAPGFMLGIIWWWMKQKSGYEIPIAETDISDHFGTAVVNKPGRMLMVACGDGDAPANDYLAELKDMGGDWLVLPCAEDASLFDRHRDQLLAAVLGMID